VSDNWLTETATFWQNSLRSRAVSSGARHQDGVFFSGGEVAEYDGVFTNTQRMLQWHFRRHPPGDCARISGSRILARRLKNMYAESTLRRDQDQEPGLGIRLRRPARARARRARRHKIPQGHQRLLHRPAGRHLAASATSGTTVHHLRLLDLLRRFPRRIGTSPRASRPSPGHGAQLDGLAWPATAASSITALGRPGGRRGRAQEVGVVGRRKWTAMTSPTSRRTRRRCRRPRPSHRARRAVRHEPFIMKPDASAGSNVPTGSPTAATRALRARGIAGAEPAHRQQSSPVLKYGSSTATRSPPRRCAIPHIMTTYGSRSIPVGRDERWTVLTELQPESFVEISPELAARKTRTPTDCVSTPRGRIRAKPS